MWCWVYKGSLEKREGARSVRLHVTSEDEEFEIPDLPVYPLDLATADTKSLPQRRGATFGTFKGRAFVNYQEDADINLSDVRCVRHRIPAPGVQRDVTGQIQSGR